MFPSSVILLYLLKTISSIDLKSSGPVTVLILKCLYSFLLGLEFLKTTHEATGFFPIIFELSKHSMWTGISAHMQIILQFFKVLYMYGPSEDEFLFSFVVPVYNKLHFVAPVPAALFLSPLSGIVYLILSSKISGINGTIISGESLDNLCLISVIANPSRDSFSSSIRLFSVKSKCLYNSTINHFQKVDIRIVSILLHCKNIDISYCRADYCRPAARTSTGYKFSPLSSEPPQTSFQWHKFSSSSLSGPELSKYFP